MLHSFHILIMAEAFNNFSLGLHIFMYMVITEQKLGWIHTTAD